MDNRRLRNKQPKWKVGQRVAHVQVDEPKGSARAGTVEEIIGDGSEALIAVRWSDDNSTEAYDARELVPLVGPGKRGPVFLSVGHVWRWITRRG